MIVLRRLATALPSVAGVIVVTFLLTRALPGDPAAYFAGVAATQQAIEEIRHMMGFDRSLPVQFVDYLRLLAHGDLGNSLNTGCPVLSELPRSPRQPASPCRSSSPVSCWSMSSIILPGLRRRRSAGSMRFHRRRRIGPGST